MYMPVTIIKTRPMKKLLYPLAIIIVITLAFGYFGFYASNVVQVLLVTAIIAILSGFVFARKSKNAN
jgi:hypothetical protein